MARILYSAVGFCMVFFIPAAWAADINATGGWTETIDAGDLVAPNTAGSPLRSTYESGAGATALDITAAGNWRVTVDRDSWTNSGTCSLEVKRAGGDYVEIPAGSSADFMTGANDTSGIDCQYRLSGMSTSVAPNTYSTTVTYTVIDQ
jgi:hypothetical protein